VTPLDPTIALGPEAVIPSLTPSGGQGAGTAPGAVSDFGSALTDAIGKLSASQDQAAQASASLAAGTASDPEQVVMAVEQAKLSMQLASQIRNRAVEAFQDIFHTQV